MWDNTAHYLHGSLLFAKYAKAQQRLVVTPNQASPIYPHQLSYLKNGRHSTHS